MSVFDLFGIFQIITDVFGKYWAGVSICLILLAAVVFYYYFKIRLPSGTKFNPSTKTGQVRRDKYQEWRVGLVDGGRIASLYNFSLRHVLDQVDQFFGDAPLGQGSSPATWTGPSLDRCLGLAVIYPIISLIVIWHLTGVTGRTEISLGFSEGTSDTARLLRAGSLIVLIRSFFWAVRPPDTHKTFMWRVIRFGAFAISVSVAFAISPAGAFAFTFAFAVAVPVAGALVFAGAFAGAGLFAFAGAFAGAGAGAVVFAISVVYLAAAVAYAVDWVGHKYPRYFTAVLLGFVLFCLVLIWLLVGSGLSFLRREESPYWTFLVFLGALPLINAVFDWLSLGFTRFLLRRGQAEGGMQPLVYALVDLFVAVIALLAVLTVSLGYIGLLNQVSLNTGGDLVLDVDGLLAAIKEDPSNPAVWWVYITIFTTFIPSLVNLTLGGLSVLRGIPLIPKTVRQYFLPEDPEELTEVRRFGASIGLTFQAMVSLILALLLGILTINFIDDLFSLVGFGLLDIATWLQSL